MFGLMVFGAMGLYLLLSIVVVFKATSHARAQGKSVKRWGWSAALVMYLIPFWDFLPTIAVHQYVCATESGFWVYKTVDQWKAENPGVMETLISFNRNPGGFNVDWPSQHESQNEAHLEISKSSINERFNLVMSQQDVSTILPIIRQEYFLVDVNKNDVIARYIGYGTGNSVKNTVGPPGPMKFWLHNNNCFGGDEKAREFGRFYIQFEGGVK